MDKDVVNKKQSYVITLSYCASSLEKGAEDLRKKLEKEIARRGLSDTVRVHLSGCLGMCEQAPVVIVNPGFVIYGNLTPDDAVEIVGEHIELGNPVGRLVIQSNTLFNRFFRIFGDIGFFGKQMRVTLRNCGVIDPESIDDYLSVRGYEALARVLTDMSPAEVIEELKESG